jgi:methionyl-tRNA synthetase
LAAACREGPLAAACREAPDLVDAALGDFDFRRATAAVWSIVEEANRHVDRVRPWHLAKAERDGDPHAAAALDDALDELLRACRALAEHLEPFLPGAAARITAQCTPVAGRLPPAQPLFPRI